MMVGFGSVNVEEKGRDVHVVEEGFDETSGGSINPLCAKESINTVPAKKKGERTSRRTTASRW